MHVLQHLLDNNASWAAQMHQSRPDFFHALARQQSPKYLWIGCADSRVPANEIVGLLPGELFVHRNVANLVVHSDLNCLSVIQYAVDVLRVEHIIVCGHYGCGGVAASLEDDSLGLIDNWLRHLRDLAQVHSNILSMIPDKQARINRLCELSVVKQAQNVAATTIVQKAWRIGRQLTVHGMIYGIADGRLKDLGVDLSGPEALPAPHRVTVLP
ncbi:MAG: carbonate dehydratase [Candidatus Hydrogenedentes bacterium]|nr:carbonate dehydratase [Candidatus Hydrogenedentota bacterium]